MLAVHLDDPEKTRSALLDVRASSSSWHPMASAESARRFHAIAAVGEYSVVILGGEDNAYLTTDTVQLYDVRADRWSERAEWSLPVPSSRHCAAVIGSG